MQHHYMALRASLPRSMRPPAVPCVHRRSEYSGKLISLNGSCEEIYRPVKLLKLRFRIRSAPSRVAFEISMFPHNLPLPPPKETGQILGVLMHITHMCAKWAGRSQAALKDDPDDIWKREVDWSGIDEGNGSRWSWVSAHKYPIPTVNACLFPLQSTPITLLLLITSLLNALYMFTRIRTYQLQHRNVRQWGSF